MGTDTFPLPEYTKAGRDSPAENAFAVTPHDSNELTYYARALYIGTGGNLKITTPNGDTVTFADVPNGFVLPVRAKIVFSTGTQATNIVALY